MSKMNIPKSALKEQEEKMKVWRYLMDSMTNEEKDNPSLINESRIERITIGSGRDLKEMRDLVKQYKHMKKMMKSISGQSRKMKRMQKLRGGKGFPGLF
jgi:signal recognition particle subunit SRP54